MAVIQPFETALVALIATYKNVYPRDIVSKVLENYCDITEKDGTWLQMAPLPVLSSIAPTTAVHGAADLTLTATGTGFTAQSQIVFNGVALATTFVSDVSITATVQPSLFAAGTVQAAVRSVDGQQSVNKPFIFT